MNMNYEDLLKWHRYYGNKNEDLVKSEGFEGVLENVVIAPWWEHSIFESLATKIEQVGRKTYNVFGDGFKFSFVEMKNIGAPSIIEEVLTLGLTKCKNLIFLGSAGAIEENINIGDIALPKASVSGVGANRYLNDNLQDDFGKIYCPNKEFYYKALQIISTLDLNVKIHEIKNFSVDSIFAQFPHIEYMKNLGCQTIEMETATLFKCAEIAGIKAIALFSISDNTIAHKSLISGRTDDDIKRKNHTKSVLLPLAVTEILKII